MHVVSDNFFGCFGVLGEIIMRAQRHLSNLGIWIASL